MALKPQGLPEGLGSIQLTARNLPVLRILFYSTLMKLSLHFLPEKARSNERIVEAAYVDANLLENSLSEFCSDFNIEDVQFNA